MDTNTKLLGHLSLLYPERATELLPMFTALITEYAHKLHTADTERRKWTERDAIVIAYADSVKRSDQRPLETLYDVLASEALPEINSVHLLPFYPWTSDDGFSVKDYLAVESTNGTWSDIKAMGNEFDLMFDAVINHISAQSQWFQSFIIGDPRYQDYFISVDPNTDLTSVTRPRTTPLLTPFDTANGTQHIWTTFSADQIDLNYANPLVLIDVIRVILEYVNRGAKILRLDAVTFLWKEIGTSCVHLPQTHEVIRLLRTILDEVDPSVTIITETNVPHEENISYLGNGHDEAQLVYNFALPPLVLHTVATSSTVHISKWINSLEVPSSDTTFFNFLASHDGIGIRGAEKILSTDEIRNLADHAIKHGGKVGYRSDGHGIDLPYELNINYFDALNDPSKSQPLNYKVRKFLTAHATMLAIPGVPGIYVHSLFGSQGWPEGVTLTGANRSINREKLDADRLLADLSDNHSQRSLILNGLKKLLKIRSGHQAFTPDTPAYALECDPRLLVIRRSAANETITCVHNFSDDTVENPIAGTDLITNAVIKQLQPWTTAWVLTP